MTPGSKASINHLMAGSNAGKTGLVQHWIMTMKHRPRATAMLAAAIAPVFPAHAAPDPIYVDDGLTVDPVIDSRLDRESNADRTVNVDALSLRMRAGAEVRTDSLSLVVDSEGTMGIVNRYDPFRTLSEDKWAALQYSDVTKPLNRLNRLHLQYRSDAARLTLGRQRIDLGGQRWPDADDWRQGGATFDAVRAQAKIGPLALDGIYSAGADAAPGQSLDGRFIFASAGSQAGSLNIRTFAYLRGGQGPAAGAQAYGARATSGIALAPGVKLDLGAAYARLAGDGAAADSPVDHLAGEAGATFSGFGILAGYEKSGGPATATPGLDPGFSLFDLSTRTPMASLLRFSGAGNALAGTPAAGLENVYAGLSYDFRSLNLSGLNASLTYHRSGSDRQGVEYGSALDASLGFRLDRFAILAKYARLDAPGTAPDVTTGTSSFGLQIQLAY
jgi:hypothetical protein